MTTLSTWGWRRDKPGLVEIIEQPSLMPKAVELLDQEGIPEHILVGVSAGSRPSYSARSLVGCRAPRPMNVSLIRMMQLLVAVLYRYYHQLGNEPCQQWI